MSSGTSGTPVAILHVPSVGNRPALGPSKHRTVGLLLVRPLLPGTRDPISQAMDGQYAVSHDDREGVTVAGTAASALWVSARRRLATLVGAPGPSWIIAVTAFGATSRLFVLGWLTLAFALTAVGWLAVRRELRPTGVASPLWVFLGITVIMSGIGWAQTGSPLQQTALYSLLPWVLVAAAVLWGSRPVQQLQALTWGSMAGLGLVYLIGLFEFLTGNKISLILHPDSSTAWRVANERFLVQSVFVNSNDFAVAMVVMFAFVGVRLIFDAGRPRPIFWARILTLATSTLMIVASTSRGALLGLAVVAALICAVSVRVVRPVLAKRIERIIGVGTVVGVLAETGIIVMAIFGSDSGGRRLILQSAVRLFVQDPVRALFGYGSYEAYSSAAQAVFGDVLMDPHNLFLELVILYGIAGLLAFVFAWLYFVWQGLVRQQIIRYSLAISSVIWVVLLPILGVVPSLFFPYSYFWVALIAAQGWLGLDRHIPISTSTVSVDTES